MPQKNKVAKKRLDKFYYLAKERGYRSRAAFKLLQLDKKYDFLSSSKGVLDLCAAPGSWMQVARQMMPATSPCIGVDLAAIKPVPKCASLQEDITTQKCRAAVKKELGHDAKVDVVLHDGAPNVGTAWLQDAYGQNELTIHALKLATEFLAPGGAFVTKAFRSADYNALLFVFGQLFSKVDATKPQASRNESAEIFVVCKGFKNAKIDPKFLDPKHVFKEMEVADDTKANVLQRKKNFKPAAEGYAEGRQLLRTECSVVDFVEGGAPVKALGEYNVFVWDDSPQCALWRSMPATKPEVYDACTDLKVLGKRDFRMLLAWRLKAAEAWRKSQLPAKPEAAAADESEDSDAEADRREAEINELERLSMAKLKGKKRKEAEKRAKMRERLSLKMEHPGDRMDVAEEMELFALKRIGSSSALHAVGTDAAADELADDDEEEDRAHVGPDPRGPEYAEGRFAQNSDSEEEDYVDKLDAELEAMYADYQARTRRRAVAQIAETEEDGPRSKKQRRQAMLSAVATEDETAEERERRLAAEQFKGIDEDAPVHTTLSDDEDDEDGGSRNPLLVGVDHLSKPSKAEAREAKDAKTSSWFAQGLFAGIDVEDDEEDVAAMADAARARRAKKEAAAGKGKGKGKRKGRQEEEAEDEEDDDEDEEEEGYEEAPRGKAGGKAGGASASAAAAADRVALGGANAPGLAGKRARLEAAMEAPRSWGDMRGVGPERRAAEEGYEEGQAEAEELVGEAAPRTKKRRRQRGSKRDLEEVLPDNARFEDLPAEGKNGQKVVGGRHAEYDSDDDQSGGVGHEESRQAALERQAESIVLGQMLLRPEKRRQLEEAAYNRHTRNDRGLPQWFVDDERKFAQPSGYGVDLDEKMLDKAKEGLKNITAHSIGKVAEAKARKQRRLQRALTKLKKKAEQVASKEDLSEREKAREVEKLYNKKLRPKKQSKTLVIGRKFSASGGGKSHGVKMVDSRLRSDVKGLARATKNNKKKSKGKGAHGGPGGNNRKGNRQKKAKQYSRR